jgi:membrane peptidoglycan carboxypeptidase
MGERLQLGRDRGHEAHDGEGRLKRTLERWKVRRAAKKRRIAAMTPTKRWLRRIGVVGTWILGLFTLLMVSAVVLYYLVTDVRRPEDIPLSQIATIEYSDGSVIARVGSENRIIVSLDKVPDATRWAVLAAEDRNFYGEPGVSVKGTLRAALNDLTGGDTQGGSGITQQYVRNAYPSVGTERTLTRKLKELMIAIKLSRDYSKNQILEFYLNTVYFGRGAYGIAAAAQTYFNTDVTKLTVAQSAVLAGLLKSPGYYDPATNREAAIGRWNYVLDGMVSTGHLSSQERARLTYPRVAKPDSSGLGASGPTWLLVNQVFADLAAHGISEKEVYAQGLTIRTTIDRKAQAAALGAIHSTFAGLTPKQRNMKNALVAVNPSNGGVLAYYGGTGLNRKGYDGKVDWNDYGAKGTRPPGSSFKPYTLATVLTQTVKKAKDQPQLAVNSYVDGSYCVRVEGTPICNDPSDKTASHSKVTIKYAMLWSLNTSFDLMASRVGPSKVAATAHAMGVRKSIQGTPTLQSRRGHTTFGIGIGDYPVSPLDQAVGFATLANQGKTNQGYFVQRATASDGTVVYQHHKQQKQAIDPKVANDVTLTMEPIPGFSQVPLAGGRVAAAKTGTEGIGPHTVGNSDAWMVGFTPQVSAAVWVGTGLNKPIVNAAGGPEYGKDLPGRTWKAFMDAYLAGKKNEPMPTKQLIQPGNGVSSQLSFTPSPSHSSRPVSSVSVPSISLTSGFPSSSAPPSLPSPTPDPTTTTSSPPPSTSSCGHILQQTCSPGPGG